MPQCASTRTQKSDDQCKAKALVGHTMCGRHRAVKVPRLWEVVNREKLRPLARVQALFRGFRARRYLRLCGPGALKRADCVNDDELATCTEKTRQYPLDYFGFEEAGKIWWFDFGTIWEWSSRSIEPTNPYTNVPLTHEVKQRLKHMWVARRRRGLENPGRNDNCPIPERIIRRWTLLCQVFRSYGFEDVHPNMFVDMTKQNIAVMFRILTDDLNDMQRKPLRAIMYCERGIHNARHMSPNGFMLTSLNALMFMLTDNYSYDIVFLILSALYRC